MAAEIGDQKKALEYFRYALMMDLGDVAGNVSDGVKYHGEVSLEQAVFTGGRLRSEILAAEREADAAALLPEQEQVDVALEVRRAYWRLYGVVAAPGLTPSAASGRAP